MIQLANSRRELKALKEELETLNKKHTELSDVELEQVAGGSEYPREPTEYTKNNTLL